MNNNNNRSSQRHRAGAGNTRKRTCRNADRYHTQTRSKARAVLMIVRIRGRVPRR